MIVYHGSYTEIKNVDLNRCEPHRDFGQAFYVTKIREQAENWAKRKGGYYNNDGFVTEFEFYYSDLVTRNCKIKIFEYYDEEWLDFIVLNRDDRNPSPAHDFDIVEGPVADDKVQTRIEDYLNGEVSKEKFLQELEWPKKRTKLLFVLWVLLFS
jgi:hypothetical protein